MLFLSKKLDMKELNLIIILKIRISKETLKRDKIYGEVSSRRIKYVCKIFLIHF